MNPWDHQAINDTVRFLARAAGSLGAERIYINPPPGLANLLQSIRNRCAPSAGAPGTPSAPGTACIPGTAGVPEIAGSPGTSGSSPGPAGSALRKAASCALCTSWQEEQKDSITVLTPPWGFAPVALGLRDLANRLTARQFSRWLAQRYGAAWREEVMVYISSWSYTLTAFIEGLAPRHLVFHLLDDTLAFPDISNYPRVRAENERFLRQLMKQSSLVIAVSEELAVRYEKLFGRKIAVVKNGVDAAHFAPPAADALQPQELAAIPGPRLMYTGSINSWVDLDLLRFIAEQMPACSLVIIGHCYQNSIDRSKWEALLAKPNVHWLGSRPYAEVPRYLHGAAVLLLPRTSAQHSQASDPLKLYEYLATGRPVVSADLPALEEFRSLVYVAPEPAAWPAKIKEALAGHSADRARQQIAAVQGHSWEARIKKIVELAERASRKYPSPCTNDQKL